MRILFVGESWLGSCARSMKEALSRSPDVVLDEINEDLVVPIHRSYWLRAFNKLTRGIQKQELLARIESRIERFKPDVLVTYKGWMLSSYAITKIRGNGLPVVNIYPDCSPHAHGIDHRKAVGLYDLVISTKPFHPQKWLEVYKYTNRCVFIPQGYDPTLHLRNDITLNPDFDLTLAATWREEYGEIMNKLGVLLREHNVRVAVAGAGWDSHLSDFPSDWKFLGELQGQSYVEFLKRSKICLGLVTRRISVDGIAQPGDVDTTRTYELAACNCFFIHTRTDFVTSIYDEQREVPMFDSVEELATLIIKYLEDTPGRHLMSNAAHSRACPAYSLDSRCPEIVKYISEMITEK